MSGAQPGRTERLPASSLAEAPVAGRFLIDSTRPLPDAGGGLPAFAAIDREALLARLMAVQIPPDAPPRTAALNPALREVPGVLAPYGHGAGRGADGRSAAFLVCTAPAGLPFWPGGQAVVRPWNEADLLRRLIVPAAVALQGLQERGLTHRAIRPENLFPSGDDGRAMLGCAWATPPAFLQPAAQEPPYVAMCLRAGRGEGGIADDIYALGVAALSLALGRRPWADLSEDEVIRRKLELGSFGALAGDARLPPLLAEVLRAMMADEPSQRPLPEQLATQSANGVRRVAIRPPRRAHRALPLGGVTAWDARSLAYALARDPVAGARALRTGVADHWLRRSLDDAALAVRLEEPSRQRMAEGPAEDTRADARLVLRAVALLDPLAPLCWGGVALWPDGIGPALAVHEAAEDTARAALIAVVQEEAAASFSALRASADEAGRSRHEARARRALLERRGWSGGVARLRYALNPLLPCRSPLLAGATVVHLAELLPALEPAVARTRPAGGLVLDADLVAFIAARQEGRLESLLAPFADGMPPARAALAQLRLLVRLQGGAAGPSLPALAALLGEAARPELDIWRSRSRRAEKAAQMAEAIAVGDLAGVLAAFDDTAARAADSAGLQQAAQAAAAIDAKLAALADGTEGREAAARALGREIAAGLGLAALAASGVAALLG